MMDKDRLIEQKNKEIVKLRMDNDELRQMNDDPEAVNHQNTQSRVEIINEIDDFLDNLKLELEKTKQILFGQENHQQSIAPSYNDQKPYNQYITEGSMLNSLFEKVSSMRNLMSLASEVYMLST